MEVACYSCKNKTSFSGALGFRAECACGEDLHVCKNCEFHDVKVYNECRETSADVIREKTRANYCEYFKPTVTQNKEDHRKALFAAAEALFKKSGDS